MEVYARKAGNYYFILYFKKKWHTSFLAANLFNCASTLWMDYVGVLKYIWKFYSVRFGIVKKYCIVLSPTCPWTKGCPSHCKDTQTLEMILWQKQHRGEKNRFLLCILPLLFPEWCVFLLRTGVNTRIFFFSSKIRRLNSSRRVVRLADATRPIFPAEGQCCRMQPVALIGNFCCCRFPLSKGQSGTAH